MLITLLYTELFMADAANQRLMSHGSCTKSEPHPCLILRNVPLLPNLLMKLLIEVVHPVKTLWCKIFNHL